MNYKERYFKLFCTLLKGIDHLTETVRGAEERFIALDLPDETDYHGLYSYLLDELDRTVQIFDRARVEI